MYTIQKYLETNIAACVLFCFPLTQVLVGGSSVLGTFLRQRNISAFQPALGATWMMPGKGVRCAQEPALLANETGQWGKIWAWWAMTPLTLSARIVPEIASPISWQKRLIRELSLIKKRVINGVIKVKFLLWRFVFLSPVSVVPPPFNEWANMWLLFAESPGFNFCIVWMKTHSLEVYTTLSFPIHGPGGHTG